jgi:hypothetical protein
MDKITSVKEMNLRDYFAAHALSAAVTKAIHNCRVDSEAYPIDWDHIADSAYDAADAMMEKRRRL